MARRRMFAGPNGSGKSSLKSLLQPDLLGVYVNPDAIEMACRQNSGLDLTDYGIHDAAEEALAFIQSSSFLGSSQFGPSVKSLTIAHNRLALLLDAIKLTNRAYIFDNSEDAHNQTWLAEITHGDDLELKIDIVPAWFRREVLDQLVPRLNSIESVWSRCTGLKTCRATRLNSPACGLWLLWAADRFDDRG